MSKKNFNLFQFTKSVVYTPVPNNAGICAIWDWSKTKNKYIRRAEGLQYYAYTRINGQQKSKCFRSVKEAKFWRENLGMAIDENPTQETTFKEVIEKYFIHIKDRVQITTLETYESSAKHLWFFNDLTMGQITAKVIDSWFVEMKKTNYLKTQHKTRNSYEKELDLLGYILSYYREYLDDNFQKPIMKRHRQDCIVNHEKLKLLKSTSKDKYIPRSEALKFLNVISNYFDSRGKLHPKWIVYKTIAEVQFGSGARIGEICALDFNDVLDWDSGAINISKSVQWSRKKGRETRISPLTKTGEKRTAYLSDRALIALKEWKLFCGRSNGLIFSFDGVKPIGYTSIQKQYDAAFSESGITHKSTHILRHSYATDFLEKTGNKSALQGQLGHKTSKMTDHYAKITQLTVKEGMAEYNKSIKEVLEK